jgi:hypothetical protein
MRGWPISLAALVAVAGLSSCGAATAGPSTTTLASYVNGPLNFTYPSTWRPQPYENVSNFTSVITYLSTDSLHDPCTRSTTANGRLTTCGWPLAHLSAGAVLVSWTEGNGLGWKIDYEAGQSMTIAGRPGKLAVTQPGQCRQINGDETMTATIATGGSSYYQMLPVCGLQTSPPQSSRSGP